ncbi:transcription initiation factor TFIID subunit 8 [Senna tora]|uniref:Transcription initiation factor TFIID subunit 8 n=1 Tax=Senna tora TaxID=362788 RepID=A0A834SDP9_9FABA|nr:transcription initiation factor TFIID subunit 8 [Senna tora]
MVLAAARSHAPSPQSPLRAAALVHNIGFRFSSNPPLAVSLLWCLSSPSPPWMAEQASIPQVYCIPCPTIKLLLIFVGFKFQFNSCYLLIRKDFVCISSPISEINPDYSTTNSSSKPPKKAKAKKKRTLVENEAQIAKSPSDFSFALAKIAVSQICQSAGFKRTQLYALETFTNVATKYLQAIAKSAASFSNASNRTDSNLFDLINAVHDMGSVQGFPTASETHKHELLSSGALKDIMKFVKLSNKLPHAKSPPCKSSSQTPNPEHPIDSSTSAGCYTSNLQGLHIPKWLPDFPPESSYKNCDKVIRERKHGEKLWEHSVAMEISDSNVEENGEALQNKKEVCWKEAKDGRMELAKERGKLKFKIGREKKDQQGFGLGMKMMNGVCKGGKRVCWNHNKMNDCMFEDKEDERCGLKGKIESMVEMGID